LLIGVNADSYCQSVENCRRSPNDINMPQSQWVKASDIHGMMSAQAGIHWRELQFDRDNESENRTGSVILDLLNVRRIGRNPGNSGASKISCDRSSHRLSKFGHELLGP
jgi:hypothetical protein